MGECVALQLGRELAPKADYATNKQVFYGTRQVRSVEYRAASWSCASRGE